MASDQISEILDRINRQLLDFDQSSRRAAASKDSRNSTDPKVAEAHVKDAQEKLGEIWENWQKLKDTELTTLEAANDARSVATALKSRLGKLDKVENETRQSSHSSMFWPGNWKTLNPLYGSKTKTELKIDEVDAFLKKVENNNYIGPDGNPHRLGPPKPAMGTSATETRSVANPALLFDQNYNLASKKGQTTPGFYKATQSDSADLLAAKRLSNLRERGLDKTLENYVRQASFKDAMGTGRGTAIGDRKAATGLMNGALAKASVLFGRDRVQQINQIQEAFVNGTNPGDPNFKDKLTELAKKVAKVLERDKGHHQYKSERANTIVNDRVWNLLWGARMGGMGMVDRNASITPNEEALARAAKLKEMDAQMGTLARTDQGGNAFAPGVRIHSDSQAVGMALA